jgi:hypothetical protein
VDLRQAWLILSVTLVLGCSASQHIAEEANTISASAENIVKLAEQIRHTSKEVESIRTATDIKNEALQIRQGVAEIHATLPGVRDVTPWWASLLQWGLIALVGGFVVWILYSTGAVTAIRIAVGWLPRRKVQEAQIAVAALDDSRPETAREWLAARRAADPEFNAAWLKAKEKTDGHQ